MLIQHIRAYPLNATWELYFGGKDKVPKHYLTPSSNFLYTPRRGQHSTLVEVELEDGTCGYGECFGLPDARYSAYYVKEYFAPILEGRPLDDVRELWDIMTYCASGIGNTSGPMMEALSGIDIALWDLKGKRAGVPTCELLGKKVQERIYCYATPIMLMPSPEQTVARARELLDMGFTALKLKAGRGVETDLEHIRAVRGAIPADVLLLLDMNCGYENRPREAAELARKAEPYGLFWFEEPLAPDDYEGYRRLRETVSIPMATGENDFTVNAFKRIVDSGCMDYVMPNVSRAGGITGMMQVAAYAAERGVKLSPHGVGAGISILAALHVMSVSANAPIYEYNQFLNPLRHGIMRNRIDYHDSYITLSGEPGLGVDVNWDTVRTYLAPGWSMGPHGEAGA